MESQTESFTGIPPFPADVPTAPLLRLSLKNLLSQDEADIQRLIKACEDLGFFYLDLRDAGASSQILQDAETLFGVGSELFGLPLEEKQRYDFSSRKSYFGYKAQGVGVVDRQGNLDRNEFYNVSKDDLMGISESLPAPDTLKDKYDILMSFIENLHSIVKLILDLLNKSLGLPHSTLANIHRLQAASGDQVRFIKAPPQPSNDRRTALGEHTDFGSVTILFNRLGGLQVLPPGADADWLYVRPLPGHAIVNLGDAMVKFTNGLLRSNIHRVVSPPGEQADSTRYSLVYFARPEDDVALRRLNGSSRIPELENGVVEEKISSKDWIIRRALGRRVDVPDIAYDESTGTEMLSRRTKVYPRSIFETPPSSPSPWSTHSSATTPDSTRDLSYMIAPHAESDPYSDIALRRNVFLRSIKDILEPLVLDTSHFDRFLGTEDTSDKIIRPHVLLDSQPTGLFANLKPYQLDGLSWLVYLKNNGIGGILADDMGLGKTLQTLSLFHTPLQNDLTELWSIIHFLFPEVFIPSTAENFEHAFSLANGTFNSRFLSHVTRFLKVVMLRRTKSTPGLGLSIPPKTEVNLAVPLAELQLDWYHKILTGVDKSILLGETGNAHEPHLQSLSPLVSEFESFPDMAGSEWEPRRTFLSGRKSRITTNILMELRKCSIHPYLLADAVPVEYDMGQHIVESSGKFIVLQKMIRQFVVNEKKKIIIFSGFDQSLNLCEDLLAMEQENVPFKHVRLDGRTSSAWRNLSVFLFQNDPRYKVFLISIRAGGEGLNLVSSSTVIFLDEDWNPQIMRQAEARVHRIGQIRPVTIFRLQSKGTVEEQMRRRLSKKAYMADKVMEEQGNDLDHPINLEAETEQDISLMPTRDIMSNSFDTTRLAHLDLSSIMQSCTLDESSVQEMSQAEKTAWLERSERVKCNIFNGQKVDTSSRLFNAYKETVIDASRASRRIGKSRVVTVGEWEVSKASIEAASNLRSPASPKSNVEEKSPKFNELSMVCPHHYCCECGKTAAEAGRLLYSCMDCPRAFCEGCLNWDHTKFIGDNAKAASHGYTPRNAFFISCQSCSRGSQKRGLKLTLHPAKRARRS
ncbi:hypothetical protein BJX99DRAFT_249193 [Aspergillus californicus]